MGKLKLRVGSILEIPLSEGRKGYGRYLYQDPEFGQLFQVYDIILKNDEELNVSTLKSTNDLFSRYLLG